MARSVVHRRSSQSGTLGMISTLAFFAIPDW
jgi:hypothetical protein